MDIPLFDVTTLRISLLYFIIYVLGYYVLLFFYLRLLIRILRAVEPENRKLNPGLVWLGMIPVVNAIWPLIMNVLVCRSIKKELKSRGKDEYGDYGMSIGIIYPVLAFGGYLTAFGWILRVAGMLIWFLFWLRMNEYKNRIGTENLPAGREDLLDN